MSAQKRHLIFIFQDISVADEVTLGFGVKKPNNRVKPMPLAALSGCVLLSSQCDPHALAYTTVPYTFSHIRIPTYNIYFYHCFQISHFLNTFQTIRERFFNHVPYQGSCHRSSPVSKASICWEFIIQFSAAIQPALFFRGV
jgi:hypothetical protein